MARDFTETDTPLMNVHPTDCSECHRLPPRPSLLDLLQGPFEDRIIPTLSITALGRLARTCRQLHAAVAAASSTIWLEAAAPELGPGHPALHATTPDQPSSMHTLRAALRSCSAAHQSICSGQFSKGAHMHAQLCMSCLHGQQQRSGTGCPCPARFA